MLNQNITPSLRQSMINEALNYHQNMNSVVFRRESQSVGVYNNPSGKTDPSQNDIIVEGNIRTRISEIAAAITRLNQTLVYASSDQVAPVYGSGISGGVRGRSGSVGRTPSGPFPPLGRSGPVRPIHPPRRSPSPSLPRVPQPTAVPPPIPPAPAPSGIMPRIEPSSSGESLVPVGTDPRIQSIFQGRYQYPPRSSQEEEEDIYDSDWAEEGSDEPIAAGPVTVVGPSSKPAASSKTRMLIDNALATILAGYNSLIDFIELQTKQRLLSTGDSQIISGLLKDLIPQLKTTIVSAQRSVSKENPEAQVDYSRIYNVVSEIIRKITSSPPFLKVDPQLLSESLPIRRDIINAPNFDPKKKVNHLYFENLLDRLKDEELKLFQFHPKSDLEKQARDDKLASIRADYTTLTQAGYKPSEKQLSEIESRITGEVEETKKVYDITKADAVEAQRLTKQFEKDSGKFKKRITEVKKELASKARALQLARASNARNKVIIASEYQEKLEELQDLEDEHMLLKEAYDFEHSYLQPRGKFKQETAEPAFRKAQQDYKDYSEAYSGRVDPASATKAQQDILFHKPNITKEQAKEAARVEKYSKLEKAPQSIFGRGKDSPTGGHVHKKSSDPFGDTSELEPYLTKYLRPSKHRRNVQPIESSSDESSGSEEGEAHAVNKPVGGRKGVKKEKEDWEIIISQPKAEAGVLIEKKKRGRGRPSKADSQAIKPVHTTASSQDLWFM